MSFDDKDYLIVDDLLDIDFDPNVDIWKIKEELKERINNTDGKDKEMYQEIMDLAEEL